MLIFDGFPDEHDARRFIAAARKLEPELDGRMYLDAAEAHAADPFPYVLQPPIVHLERPDDCDDEAIEAARSLGYATEERTSAERELELERLVGSYGGTYAGT